MRRRRWPQLLTGTTYICVFVYFDICVFSWYLSICVFICIIMRNMHEKDEVASATDVDRLAIGNETTTAFFNAWWENSKICAYFLLEKLLAIPHSKFYFEYNRGVNCNRQWTHLRFCPCLAKNRQICAYLHKVKNGEITNSNFCYKNTFNRQW